MRLSPVHALESQELNSLHRQKQRLLHITMSVTAPDWLDKGDNAWQLTAASLVAMQSIPGLVVMYLGIVKKKWAVNSAFMAFYGFACTLICWVLWCYKAAFGNQMLPFVGVPGPVVTMNGELTQALLPTSGITANFPMSTMGGFFLLVRQENC